MIEIYKKSFACVVRFWWFYLLIAAVIAGLPMLLKSGSASGTSVGYLFFLLFLHRHVLFCEGLARHKIAPGAPKRSDWGFLWVNILIGIGVADIVLGLLFGLPENAVSKAVLSNRSFQFLALVPAYWLALSSFGTALPASAANERYGLRLTLQRSRQTAFDIAWRLLLGPGLFTVVLSTGLLFCLGLVLYALGLDKPHLERLGLAAQGLAFAVSAIVQLILPTASTMGVVILCEAYRRVQPAPMV